MITLYKNIAYKLELVVLDNDGKFASGLTVTYEIRKCSDDSLFASGTMSETSSVYYVDVIFTTSAEYRIKYVTPTLYENGFDEILVEDYNNYKADVSALALDATVAKEATLGSPAHSTISNDLDAINSETSSIIATLSTLVASIWSYGTRTLTSYGTLIADIWSYSTRTLTSFGSLVTSIWANITRTLTSGTKDSEIDAIKVKTDNLPIDPASESGALAKDSTVAKDTTVAKDATVAKETQATINKNNIITEVNANETKIDAIKTEEDLIKIETDKILDLDTQIKRILGLNSENYKITSFTYTGELLTGATIKIYPTKADVLADTNSLATYLMVATYDVDGKSTGYRVTKE